MKRIFTAAILVAFSCHANAFGGDGAIITQLQIQTGKLVEQLKAAKDSLDVSERMEEMESLRFVKRISAEGRALQGVIYDVNEATGLFEDQSSNPAGHKDIAGEIQRLSDRINSADNPSAYAHILSDLERLKVLGQANQATMRQAVHGTDEQDDIKSTSTSSMIMADIMINQEKRQAIKRAEEQQSMQSLMGSPGYSSIYGEN